MADVRTTPQQLFKQWRFSGDAAAGQQMAQRFTDWYYAVSTARLGDAHGRAPMQRACLRFQQGIVNISEPGELADWAHAIIADEIREAGGRIGGGDFPNALTDRRPPSELLAEARGQLAPAQLELLALTYDAAVPMSEVTRAADALGGMPVAVLEARHALKQALRANGVKLSEVAERPNLDCAPLPVYESGRMTNPTEEANFEKWLLSDLSLCKDVAEFAAFALSIRTGALRAAAPARAATAPGIAPSTRSPAAPQRPRSAASALGPVMILGVGLVVAVLAAGLVAAMVFLAK
jgi:hypothetical protein